MSRSNKSSRGRQATLGGTILAVVVILAFQSLEMPEGEFADTPPEAATSQETPSSLRGTADADARIEAAVRERRSGFMITVDGEILKLLPDDNEGSRHQRLLIELATGRTLLVAHNIDLAARVPASRGDHVRIRGQYEWNDRGGVLHWTHYDPDGRHEGGWVEFAGKRYGESR